MNSKAAAWLFSDRANRDDGDGGHSSCDRSAELEQVAYLPTSSTVRYVSFNPNSTTSKCARQRRM